METGSKVKVKLPKITFTGIISAVNQVGVIVQIDPQYLDAVNPIRNENFDPPGCIVVHERFVSQ